jgi:hypothetical protein
LQDPVDVVAPHVQAAHAPKLPRPRIELRPPHEHLAADPIAGQWMGGVDQMIAEAAHRDTAVLCQRAERFKKGSTGVLTMIFSAITPRTPRTFIGLARSHSWSSHEFARTLAGRQWND